MPRLVPAPANAIGVLLGMQRSIVLVARARLGMWLGISGLFITLLAAAATGSWLVRSSLRAMADNAGTIVVIVSALISGWFAVHNAAGVATPISATVSQRHDGATGKMRRRSLIAGCINRAAFDNRSCRTR